MSTSPLQAHLILAVIWRNIWRLLHNPRVLAFIFLLPAIEVALFCFAIGPDPKGISLGYVNLDTPCNVTYADGQPTSEYVRASCGGCSLGQVQTGTNQFVRRWIPLLTMCSRRVQLLYVCVGVSVSRRSRCKRSSHELVFEPRRGAEQRETWYRAQCQMGSGPSRALTGENWGYLFIPDGTSSLLPDRVLCEINVRENPRSRVALTQVRL